VTGRWRSLLASTAGLALTAAAVISSVAGGPVQAKAFKGIVKFGVVAGFTGYEGFLGPDLMTGANDAAAQINAAGGINGYKLVFTTADTAGDPVDAIPAFRKMISVTKPAAIIGPFSNSGVAVLPIIAANHTPVFELGGTTQLNNVTIPYFWRTNTSDNQEGTADAYWAIHNHWMRAAFAYTTAASAQTLMAPTRAAYTKHGGKIVATVNLVPDASSYRSEILQLLQAHPQVIFFQQDPQTAGTFFTEAAQLGLDSQVHWIGTDVEFSSDVFKALGPKIATTNMVFTNNSLSDNKAQTIFIQWYKKLYHTSLPAVAAPQAYDAVITAALAMVAAHSFSGPAVNSKILYVANPPGIPVYSYAQGLALLKQGKKINYEGVGSTVDFNSHHSVTGPFGVYEFSKNGTIVPVANISSITLENFSK
jgi:ABC-type branched-subunit amino acid transport system substrate-binding protein